MRVSVKRQRRVAELLHEAISHLLQFEIRDPRIGFVTVTAVEVNSDLTIATVYISLLSDELADEAEVLAGLASATPYLKRALGPMVKLRFMPEIQFEIDRSTAYSQKIQDLLSQIDIPPPIEEDDESVTS